MGKETTIHLFSGEDYDISYSKALKLEDIAHVLSHMCIFGGHYNVFYSVAEHSIRVSQLAPKELKLLGLFHDCAKVITGNLTRPFRGWLYGNPEYSNVCYMLQGLEHDILLATLKAHDIPYSDAEECWENIERIDEVVLEIEKKEWGTKTSAMTPVQAEQAFLVRYEKLKAKVVKPAGIQVI